MKNWIIVGALTLLAGCATSYPSSLDPHASYRFSEGSSLRGMAGVRDHGEALWGCSDVWLFPRTPYFERALSDNALPVLSPNDRALIRHAACDASGDFDFDHLPAEDWIMAAYVPTSSTHGVVMTRMASSRVGTEDEVFLYVSDSEVKEWGDLNPSPRVVRSRRVMREEVLPWGHKGDK